jgi:hypothetical protein
MDGWIDVHWIEGLEMIVVPPGETVVLVVARSRRVASKPLAHLSSLISLLSSRQVVRGLSWVGMQQIGVWL